MCIFTHGYSISIDALPLTTTSTSETNPVSENIFKVRSAVKTLDISSYVNTALTLEHKRLETLTVDKCWMKVQAVENHLYLAVSGSSST